jgi:nucleoside-diphosphate-sugar epimerase
MAKFLVTGAAGFIGSYVAKRLLESGEEVIGVDNMNDYYSPLLKQYRLETLKTYEGFRFYQVDIEEISSLAPLFKQYRFEGVINLAARAGVRQSLLDPFVYERTNSLGTLNLLELCRQTGVRKFVLASTSSLYAGQPVPFKEDLPVNTPISPYAASKKAAEMHAHAYHYLYGIDVTIVRYFTVYGPAGRPDMSAYRFAYQIINGETMTVYGDGTQSRDFTYVEDIAEGTVKALKPLGFEIVNLGNDHPHELKEMIALIEQFVGKKGNIEYKPFHKADIKATWASIDKARSILHWEPKIQLEEGIRRLVDWFQENPSLIQRIPLKE